MKKKDVRSMKLTMQLKSRSYDIILKAGCLANLHQFTNVADVYKRQNPCSRALL